MVKRKRLRKKKGVGLRKKLRTHIESVEEFNPEARDAQSAELERIRRLELQRSISSTGYDTETRHGPVGEESVGAVVLQGVGAAMGEEGRRQQPLKGSSSPDVLQVVEKVDLSQVAGVQRSESSVEPIIIDSGSSDSDANYQRPPLPRPPLPPLAGHRVGGQGHPAKRGAGPAPPQRQLCGKYDMFTPRSDGRVLVNEGHLGKEVEVFLAPQIASIAKPHQVGHAL